MTAEVSVHRTHGSGDVAAAITRRIRSAFRLFEERQDEIVVYLDGSYGVPSRSVAGLLYHVDIDHGTCECPDQAKGGHHCAHLFCAEICRAKGVPDTPHGFAGAPTATRRASRRCEGKAAA